MQVKLDINSKKSIALRLAGTILALSLLVILLRQQGWAEIIAAIQNIQGWRFAVALLLMLGSRLAVTGRWHILLRSAGMEVPFLKTARLTFSGLFASNFLPTTIGGDAVRFAGAIQQNMDGAICAASLIVDRFIGMAAMAMAVPLGIPSFLASTSIESSIYNRYPELLSIFVPPVMIRVFVTIKEKASDIWRKFHSAFSSWAKKPGVLLISLAFSWLHMLCLFASIELLLDGTGEDVPLWMIAGLWSVVYFITLIPISINGYGIQEVSMSIIFSSVGGASSHNSLTVALLIRTIMMLASLPGAVFIPGIMATRKSKGEKAAP